VDIVPQVVPVDISNPLQFLASEEGRYIIGDTFPLDSAH
jgi:hypothetical protein